MNKAWLMQKLSAEFHDIAWRDGQAKSQTVAYYYVD